MTYLCSLIHDADEYARPYKEAHRLAMRICIVNDDGIHGEGLTVLANWAKKLGEVTIFAPKVQQSGKSHSIELHESFEVAEVEHPSGVRAFTVDSTPADCVRVALLAMGEKFDLVLSGVNCGYNLGREMIYSGTVGAALEAAVSGVKAIAFSTGFDTFAGAEAYLDAAWAFLQEHELLSKAQVWNINIPEEPTGECRITRQGGAFFSDEFRREGNMFFAAGKCIYTPTPDGRIDTNAVLRDRCISFTPIRNDKTDHDVLRQLID